MSSAGALADTLAERDLPAAAVSAVIGQHSAPTRGAAARDAAASVAAGSVVVVDVV